MQFCNEAKSCAHWLVNETLWYETETRPRRLETTSRDRLETETSRPRLHHCGLRYDGSRPRVQSASLYDNFCKTGNDVIDVIDDVIIWVQDGNCKKWLERSLVLVRSTI